MRIAVIGAGIVGVTTAFELSADGHEVTVFERRGSVAEEASFANAGVLAPGAAAPWSAPAGLWQGVNQLFARHALVRLPRLLAAREWASLSGWLWRWRRACRPGVHAASQSALLQLGQLSRQRMAVLTTQLALDYEQQQGYLVLLRSDRELSQARAGLRRLADLGLRFELIDAARCREIEPGLAARTALRAAIHLPNDGVGNCRQFAQLIKSEAQRHGAVFRFDEPVHQVLAGASPSVVSSRGQHTVDAIVLCTGAAAGALLAPLGIRLPLLAVSGYSITAPLRHHDGHADIGPRGGLLDERYKVVISRLGQRVRVAGIAEIGRPAERLDPAALATLYKVLDDWFPGAVLAAQTQRWKGARPVLPDGAPVLGRSGAAGIWLNLGHGSSGWALSCGSARSVSDLVAGRQAPLDLAPFAVERLG